MLCWSHIHYWLLDRAMEIMRACEGLETEPSELPLFENVFAKLKMLQTKHNERCQPSQTFEGVMGSLENRRSVLSQYLKLHFETQNDFYKGLNDLQDIRRRQNFQHLFQVH